MPTRIRFLLASLLFLVSIGATAVAHAQDSEKDAEQVEQEASNNVSESPDPGVSMPEWRRWEGTSIAMQSIAGIGTGVLGAVIAGKIASDLCDPTNPHALFPCLGEVILAGSISGALSTSIGVLTVGALAGGDGAVWATVLGSALGGVVGFIPAFPLLFANEYLAVGMFLGTATMGGVIGYHESSSRIIMPQVGVVPTDGGMALSIGFEF